MPNAVLDKIFCWMTNVKCLFLCQWLLTKWSVSSQCIWRSGLWTQLLVSAFLFVISYLPYHIMNSYYIWIHITYEFIVFCWYQFVCVFILQVLIGTSNNYLSWLWEHLVEKLSLVFLNHSFIKKVGISCHFLSSYFGAIWRQGMLNELFGPDWWGRRWV